MRVSFWQWGMVAVAAGIVAACAAGASAAPIVTAANAAVTGLESTPFTVSSTDIGQTHGVWSMVSGTQAFSSNVTKLNDGLKFNGAGAGITDHTLTPSNGAVAQLTFSAAIDIGRIVSLTGTGGAIRSGQAYTVSYSTDGILYTLLQTVGGEPNNVDVTNREVQVTIEDSLAAPLALNVHSLRFTFANVGTHPESMYREIDVFGTLSSVPEPQSVLLWSLVAVCGSIFCWRRNKARKVTQPA